MIVVNVFTEDGHDVTLLVGLDQGDDIRYKFEFAWGQALEKARKDDPIEWNVNQVYKILRDSGWNIIICRDAVEVSY